MGRSLLARFGIEVREGEGIPAFLMFLGFFLLITFQYTAKTVREATFIADVGPTFKPIVYLLAAVFSYPCLRVFGYFAKRMKRHKLLIMTCVTVAASMVGFWFIYQMESKAVPYVFYVWVSVVFVMTVSQYWAYAGTVFDPRQAKRLFAFLGAGGLLGGLAGGKIAGFVAARVSTYNVLFVSAILMGGVILVMWTVHRIAPPDEARIGGVSGGKLAKMDAAKGGFAIIKSSRHLVLIMCIMILTVMVANVVDFQFGWAVDQHFEAKQLTEEETRNAIGRFYGNFFFWMGVASFIFQLLFTARIHRTLGVGVAMRILPVTMAIGTVGIFFAVSFPGALLGVAYALKVGENGLRYSLDQATRELLFLPVPANLRVKAKAYIDVFVQRGAKGLIAIMLLTVTFELITPVQAGWFSLVLIVAWMYVIHLMSKEYVKSFREGLKDIEEAVPINVSDVTTLELLVESLGSSDPRQVRHSLNLLQSNKRGKLVPPLLLYHDDPGVRQHTLQILREVNRTDAIALIEGRLGDPDPDVQAEAINTLADMEGQEIVDMMLPKLRDAEPGVRAAAVASITNDGDDQQRKEAREVLLELLSDADELSRVEAAKALGAIHEPEMQDQLIRLLYDRSPKVVREAILAIRRRVRRDGYNPMYVPTLISLLHDRRLKQDAREALVAFGDAVIPALVHFMSASDEPLWVRRALPKTIARIEAPQAAEALVASLGTSDDRFLRKKVIEAIGFIGGKGPLQEHEDAVAAAIRAELGKYYLAFQQLTAIGVQGKGDLSGPEVDWKGGEIEPGLLEKLLGERMGEHLGNIFGLLGALHPPKDMSAAYRSLLSGQANLRNNALEYLDNTLSVALRQILVPVLDSRPVEDKLKHASSIVGSSAPSRPVLLRALLESADAEDETGLKVAAMYYIYAEGLTDLYPAIAAARQATEDSFVAETADWVAERVA
jgi:AAA family ATP:ADP antiporter